MKRFFYGGLVGLQDSDGNVLLEAKYDYLWVFGDYCLVNKCAFYGVIRISDRKEIVPVKFSSAKIYENYTIVKDPSTGKYGIYKNDGTILAEPIFDSGSITPVVATVRNNEGSISIYP